MLQVSTLSLAYVYALVYLRSIVGPTWIDRLGSGHALVYFIQMDSTHLLVYQRLTWTYFLLYKESMPPRMEMCVCVHYCSTYYKAVRVWGGQ